jgi:hypothetical protein
MERRQEWDRSDSTAIFPPLWFSSAAFIAALSVAVAVPGNPEPVSSLLHTQV